MTTRNALGMAVLLIAAIGSVYLAQSLTSVDPPAPTGQVSRSGFYLKSARILGTDENGRRLYEIEADFAEQQPNNEIKFQNVQIQYASNTEIPWKLNADTAVIGTDRRQVRLKGHVTAISDQGFSGEVTEIRTQYLEFEPDLFKAETDQRVQIRIGSRSLTATGMLALLQNNRLILKSNVSGKFVP